MSLLMNELLPCHTHTQPGAPDVDFSIQGPAPYSAAASGTAFSIASASAWVFLPSQLIFFLQQLALASVFFLLQLALASVFFLLQLALASVFFLLQLALASVFFLLQLALASVFFLLQLALASVFFLLQLALASAFFDLQSAFCSAVQLTFLPDWQAAFCSVVQPAFFSTAVTSALTGSESAFLLQGQAETLREVTNKTINANHPTFFILFSVYKGAI